MSNTDNKEVKDVQDVQSETKTEKATKKSSSKAGEVAAAVVSSEKVEHLGMNDDRWFRAIHARKAVSRIPEDCTEGLTQMLIAFSALCENDETLGGLELAKWPIPNWAVPFVLPSKVCVSGANTEMDMLIHPAEAKPNMTLSEWRDLCEVIANALTKKPCVYTGLDEVKRPALLSNVKNPSYNGLCKYDDQVPWPLTVQVHKPRLAKLTYDDFIDEAVRNVLDNYKQ